MFINEAFKRHGISELIRRGAYGVEVIGSSVDFAVDSHFESKQSTYPTTQQSMSSAAGHDTDLHLQSKNTPAVARKREEKYDSMMMQTELARVHRFNNNTLLDSDQ